MKSLNASSPRVPMSPHTSLEPLQVAAKAIDAGNWWEAQQRLDMVSSQLAALASVSDEDLLRQRQQAMALRLNAQAQALRERMQQRGGAQEGETARSRTKPAAAAADERDRHVGFGGQPQSKGQPGSHRDLLASMVCPPAIRDLVMARFVLPLRHPQQAARYRQRPGGGLLLFGPPGTGKTHLVRALGAELGLPVFAASPAQLVSKWLGDSEKQLAELFEKARKEPAALVFVDEIDVLAPSREQSEAAGSGVMQRLLAQMLTELDGFAKAQGGLLFVGATNRPWVLDKALLRPGRFDAMAYLGTPGGAARVALLKQALTGMPVQKEMAWQTAAASLQGRTAAQVVACAQQAARCAFERSLSLGSDQDVLLEDVLRAASEMGLENEQDKQRFSDFAAQHGAVWPSADEGGGDDGDPPP